MSSYSTSKLPRIGCAAMGPGILEMSSAMRRRRAMCTATGTIHESSRVRDHKTLCDEKGRNPVKVMGNSVASPPTDMAGQCLVRAGAPPVGRLSVVDDSSATS